MKILVSESELKKKADSYNNYTLTLSFGQLECIHRALAKDHSDSMADELFSELGWFLSGNIPMPGEDKSASEREKEAEKERSEVEKEADKALEMPGHPSKELGVSPEAGPESEVSPPEEGNEADDILPAPPG